MPAMGEDRAVEVACGVSGSPSSSSCDDFSKFVAGVVGKLLAEVPVRSGSFVAKEHARQLMPLLRENLLLRRQLASNMGQDCELSDSTIVDIDNIDMGSLEAVANHDGDSLGLAVLSHPKPLALDSNAIAVHSATDSHPSSHADCNLELPSMTAVATKSSNVRHSDSQADRASPSQPGVRNFELHSDWRKVDNAPDMPSNPSWASMSSSEDEESVHEKEALQEDITREPSMVDEYSRCAVHPGSKPRLCWDLLGTLLLCFDLIMIPLGAFDLPDNTFLDFMSWTTLIFWTCDIVASCFTGYNKGPKLIMHPKRIMAHYFRTWFALDCIVVGVDWIGVIFDGNGDGAAGVLRAGKLLRILRVLRTLRLLRLAKLRTLVSTVQDHVDSDYLSILMAMLKNIVVIVAINHFIACGWYAIGTRENKDSWVPYYGYNNASKIYRYTTALHWSLTQFTPASMNVQPRNLTERAFAVVVLLFALIVFSSFLSSITSSMTNLRNLSTHRSQQFFLLRKFLRQNKIPEDLQYRVNRYVHVVCDSAEKHLEQKRIELLPMLSKPLLQELQGELYRPTLCAHPLFARIAKRSMQVIQGICSDAVSVQGLSKNDILFNCGDHATHMYFLARGLMAYHPWGQNREQRLLKPHEWCSEGALWTQWVHHGKLRAQIECSLYALESALFRQVILSNPSHAEFPKRYGEAFVHAMNMSLISETASTSQGRAGRMYLSDLRESVAMTPQLEQLLHDTSPSSVKCDSPTGGPVSKVLLNGWFSSVAGSE